MCTIHLHSTPNQIVTPKESGYLIASVPTNSDITTLADPSVVEDLVRNRKPG